jgi:hypothetical protein
MCYTREGRNFEAEEHRGSSPLSYLNATSIVP